MRQMSADRKSEQRRFTQRRFIRWLSDRDEGLAASATDMTRECQKLKQHPRVARETTGAGDVARSRFPVNHARRWSNADTNASESRFARTFTVPRTPFVKITYRTVPAVVTNYGEGKHSPSTGWLAGKWRERLASCRSCASSSAHRPAAASYNIRHRMADSRRSSVISRSVAISLLARDSSLAITLGITVIPRLSERLDDPTATTI